jgi:hypothetical protein
LKIWLLDADIIIDFLSLGIFDNLVKNHEIYVASSVINEVKFYKRSGARISIDFMTSYIRNGAVKEVSATTDDLKEINNLLPENLRPTIHSGEFESISILMKRPDLIFCSCDAATIRLLPLLDLSERGVSAEKLLRESGLRATQLQDRHTEEYF